MSEFRHKGLVIRYDRDRAATDLGMQLKAAPGSLELSGVRVWFQFKGKHESTYTAAQFAAGEPVPVSVKLDHLRFWYAGGEATYLVVYLESVNLFLAEDVRDIVDRTWGPVFLAPGTFPGDQESVTVKLSSSAILSTDVLDRMLAHRSMRIDGPAFRGRPLGHRLDPLRSQLGELEPEDFEAVVNDLLRAHGYKIEEELDPGLLLQGITNGASRATLSLGVLYATYEWVFQLGTEFGYGPNSDFREEGQLFRAHGKVAVLIHSKVDGRPVPAATAASAIEHLKSQGANQLLVFGNTEDTKLMGPYRVMTEGFCQVPQGLGSLAYNVLTTTLVYLDYRTRLRWRLVNYLSGR